VDKIEEGKEKPLSKERKSKSKTRPSKEILEHKSPRVVEVFISKEEPNRQMRFEWNEETKRFELLFGSTIL